MTLRHAVPVSAPCASRPGLAIALAVMLALAGAIGHSDALHLAALWTLQTIA